MDRLACVDLPELPLQLLLARRPGWEARPVAVVAEDKPQARVEWVNEHARRRRVLAGMRYAQGLALASDLCAGVVHPGETAAAVDRITRRLRRHTPDVEPCEEEPGVFWLDAAGLGRLHPSLDLWAHGLLREVGRERVSGRAVVGFDRFGTYALARARRAPRVRVTASAEEERRLASAVPLDRLGRIGLDPDLRDALARLGVLDVGAFLALPAGGLIERFGPEAHRLHLLASGRLWTPLRPAPEEEPVHARADLDHPEADLERLLFCVKRLVDRALAALARRGRALAGLRLGLGLDGGGAHEAHIRPAAPTLDGPQIVDLVRLRLEAFPPPAAVTGVDIVVEEGARDERQLGLFADGPRRDLDAANRALARLRTELGERAVVRAALRDGHLPEARFAWEPMREVRPSARVDVDDAPDTGDDDAPGARPLVRRILARPEALPEQQAGPDGWLAAGLPRGEVQALVGPYVLSGGWWRREIEREYYFARLRRGEVLWIFYDRLRRRWFLHGRVE